jgi:hypothetical protein
MNVLFEGIRTISVFAVSGVDDPSSVTEGHVSNLFGFSPGDTLTNVLLVYPKRFQYGEVRGASRRGAEQRITEVIHCEIEGVD